MTEPQPAAVGVIEMDAFCEGCGFNLCKQAVWRDERLGLLVCRCPECGKHQSGQGRSTVGTVWLSRLATAALVGWVVGILLFVLGVGLFMLSHYAIAEETMTLSIYENLRGEEVELSDSGKSDVWRLSFPPRTTVPVAEVRRVWRLQSWVTGRQRMVAQGWRDRGGNWPGAIVVLGLFSGATVMCGSFLASVAWFWRRGRMWVWLLLPVVACAYPLIATVFLVSSFENHKLVNSPDHSALFALFAAVLVAQLLVLGLGLLIGRPLARLVLSMFVPPRARQVFAFLWLCDGKKPPGTQAMAD